jgi:hypothetical protein
MNAGGFSIIRMLISRQINAILNFIFLHKTAKEIKFISNNLREKREK